MASFRRSAKVKEHGVWVEKANAISTKSWVEEGMAETLNIDMCLTSRICEHAGCWHNRVFFGHFKTFVNCGFSAFAKEHRSPRTVILMH
jgi:hypothetical protein